MGIYPALDPIRPDNTATSRMKLFIFLMLIGVAVSCEYTIKTRLKEFGQGKDFQKVFNEYATNGYIGPKGMGNILYDAGVSWGCRWPYKVIAKLDLNDDGKLTFDEINSAIQNAPQQDMKDEWIFN